MQVAIVIPARSGSKRFPNKPLARLQDQSMLWHVVALAKEATRQTQAPIYVATDTADIADAAEQAGARALLTSVACHSGTDRVWAAIQSLPESEKPEYIINLQGDVPCLPSVFLEDLLSVRVGSNADLETMVIPLTWAQLADLRTQKETRPFSGTTAILDGANCAVWFSKQIIPAIREDSGAGLSKKTQNSLSELSPVYQHVGLYGYTYDSLKRFVALPPSRYEKLEGLEQLRALENGLSIHCTVRAFPYRSVCLGVDTPEDLEHAVAYMNASQTS